MWTVGVLVMAMFVGLSFLSALIAVLQETLHNEEEEDEDGHCLR